MNRIWRKSTLALLMVPIYLISFTYASGISALQNSQTAPVSIDYWDGTDSYTGLDEVLAALEIDSDNCYHITKAAQLHAVIKYNGGGHVYKLDNDIAINADYEDYSGWGSSAPANEWSFGTSNWYSSIGNSSFRGTLDGCGHTVYGLYSNGGKAYNGLIPQVGAGAVTTTVIKNLNVWYSYVKVNGRAAGILIGSTYNGNYSATVDAAYIEGCSVRYAAVDVPAGNSVFGGIVGLARRKTTIAYCSVADVVINPIYSTGSTTNDYGGLCSLVGSNYESNGAYSSALNTNQAKFLKISNCYAVNVVNAADNEPVYVAGVFESQSNKWGFCISAYNVYSDGTTVSHANNKSIKLLVSLDGETKITTKNDNYPIKAITADDIKGDVAKTAMPTFEWDKWKTAPGDYPYYVGKAPLKGVWDGKDDYTSLAAVMEDLGETDSDGYYHIQTPNQLHAVIRFQGGNNKYKLDNDIYINDDFENYESWGSNAPANTWQFNQASNWNASSMTPFTGTIDGNGHTIYGLFSNTEGNYNGLIGATTGNTVIKNLNVSYAYLNAKGRAGVLVGCKRGGTLTIDSCTVSNIFIKGSWENVPAGGMVGVTYPNKTLILDCAVRDVKFTGTVAKENAASKENPYAFGSFIGAVYTDVQTPANAQTINGTQASNNEIQSSYAVNVMNITNGNTPVYVCGLYHEGSAANNNTKWGYSITAKDVYTDATMVPSSNVVVPQVKLLVTTGGTNAIPPTDSNYPVKTIAANSIIGDAAKTAMPTFDWCKWNTVSGYYPTPQGGHVLAHHPMVPASCEESGVEEYWNCVECNKLFGDNEGKEEITEVVTIEPLHHKNAVYFKAKEATCTADGNLAYWYCPDCKRYSTNSDFTATCEQAVVMISKINHIGGLLHYTAAPALCDEDGHIEYWHCTYCNRYYTDEACQHEVSKDQVITEKATGHKNRVFHSATAAGDTCRQPGTIAHWECLDCNRYFEDEACTKELIFIDAPSSLHTPKKVTEKKATCYETGRKEYYECTTCGKYFEDAACSKQVLFSNLTVPAIKHGNATYNPELLPACITDGLKAHWYCPDCKGYFSNADLSEKNKVEYIALIVAAHGHVTSEDTVTKYDAGNHWQICDLCGAEINCEPHKLSDEVSVYDGKEKRCKCGFSLQKFDLTANGVNVSADYGVFDAETTIKISKVTSGSSYEKVMSAIGNEADELAIYDITAKKGAMKLLPQGKVKITLPVGKRFSGNVAIYTLDENGNAKKVEADYKRKESVANLALYGLGTFAVVDLGIPYTAPESNSDFQVIDQESKDGNALIDKNTDTTISDDGADSSESNAGQSATNEENTSNRKKKNGDQTENASNGTLIFIVAAVVAGFVLITFGTVLIVRKHKKHKKQ